MAEAQYIPKWLIVLALASSCAEATGVSVGDGAEVTSLHIRMFSVRAAVVLSDSFDILSEARAQVVVFKSIEFWGGVTT